MSRDGQDEPIDRSEPIDQSQPIDPALWAKAQQVFHAALELAAEGRSDFVRRECGSDSALAALVLELIEEDASDGSVLDRGVAQVASEVLDGSVPRPEAFGPYRVERILGRGGMGVVYLATRDDLGLTAAVKVLRDATLSPDRRERFSSEQRTLARLNHPRIARLYDADVLDDGTPYFVMEYVEGEPLDAYCAGQAMTVADRLRLFRAICDAVQFAHGRAVIHRDIKPSNILVTEQGEPKLLDFGIAKQLEVVDGDERVTRTGLRLMTPSYAAPEQLLGEPVGVYTDVYALGAVLYGLLAGAPPFDLTDRTPAQVERLIVDTGPGKVSEHLAAEAGTSSDDLDVLCSTAMHREIERRYASVEALVRDIDHFLAGEPLEARPDSVAYRATKFIGRNRRAVAFTTVAATVLVGMASFYTWRLAEARDLALQQVERTRRIQSFTRSLFSGGDEVAGPADTLRVLTLVERGVQQARLLDGDPAPQAEMFLTLGRIYTQLGRHERADSLLNASLANARALDPPNPDAVAEAVIALGELRLEEGEYAEAESLLAEAMSEQSLVRATTDPLLAGTKVALGRALEGQGEYGRAIALLDEAVRALETRDDTDVELSVALGSLAVTHFYTGDLDAADSVTNRALEIDRRLYGDGHPNIADGLINLAASEVQRGRYAEAGTLFREAMTVSESYYGPDHLETASAMRMLGNSLLFQGRMDEAEPLLLRALAIQERALSPEHPRLANTMGDLAYIQLENGRFEEAFASYRRIVDIYKASNGERHYFVAIGLSNLANALMEGDRLEESEAMFRDVVVRFAETRGERHVDTGIAHIKLGRVLQRQGRPEAAEQELLRGHAIVSAEMQPNVSWLRSARQDLIAISEALGKPDQAARFIEEQARADSIAASDAS